MTALTTGARRVGRVYRVQGHTRKSSLVGKEETELCKSPGGMTRTLGTSNRALGSLPNVPEFLNRYSLMVSLSLLNNAFGDDMIRVLIEEFGKEKEAWLKAGWNNEYLLKVLGLQK